MNLNSLRFWWQSNKVRSIRGDQRLKAIRRLPGQPVEKVAGVLIQLLEDPDEEIRAATATRIAELHCERAVIPLVKRFLQERDPNVRTVAASALASFPAKGWVPVLIAALDDPQMNVRDTASWVLRTEAWASIEEPIRGRVAVMRGDWAMAVQVGNASVPILKETLLTGTPNVRREVARALGGIGSEAALAAVLEVLRDRRAEPNAREIAGWALRSFRWPQVDAEDAARAAIAVNDWAGAAKMGDAAVLPLTFALKGPDTQARQSAAETLGRIGTRPAAEALAAALVDQGQDAAVRTIAAEQLGVIGGEYVLAVLTAALADKDWLVRVSAAGSLGRLNWQPIRDGERGLFAIARLRIDEATSLGSAVVPLLVDALTFPAVSLQAAAGLARLGPEGADVLVAISRDPKTDYAVREAAAAALASSGDERALQPLHAMLNDPDMGIRQAAVWALERMGWEPRKESEQALFALVHEDWSGLCKLGPAAVDLLLHRVAEDPSCGEAQATLETIVKTAGGRLSIEQLRRLGKLGGDAKGHGHGPPDGGSSGTTTLTECARLSKLAKFELIRRGIL